MNITKELVRYVAALSRLQLDEAETEHMQRQMSEIVSYMDVLGQLDTEGIEPLSHVFPVTNVMRPDTPVPSYDRDALLQNAPQRTDETIVVPKTVE